jgi:hypothetical protein
MAIKKIDGKGYGLTPQGFDDAVANKPGAEANLWSTKANPALAYGNPLTVAEVQDPMGVGMVGRGKKKPLA